jgi:hypothetical protein
MLPVDLTLEVAGSFVALLVLEGNESGHGLDDRVPLCLDQSTDFLINLLQLGSLTRND